MKVQKLHFPVGSFCILKSLITAVTAAVAWVGRAGFLFRLVTEIPLLLGVVRRVDALIAATILLVTCVAAALTLKASALCFPLLITAGRVVALRSAVLLIGRSAWRRRSTLRRLSLMVLMLLGLITIARLALMVNFGRSAVAESPWIILPSLPLSLSLSVIEAALLMPKTLSVLLEVGTLALLLIAAWKEEKKRLKNFLRRFLFKCSVIRII